MLLTIPGVLEPAEAAECCRRLSDAPWTDGRLTAGAQSAMAKANLQLPEDAPQARAVSELILERLSRNPAFVSAALPAQVFPPLFNRYDVGMGFGDHIDNAIRTGGEPLRRYRTDLSCTLSLSSPADYDGGELIIRTARGEEAVRSGKACGTAVAFRLHGSPRGARRRTQWCQP